MATPDNDLNYAIVRLARRHRYVAGELLGELGVYPGQEGVLHLLWERDQRSQAELAAALGVEPPTMHRTLASLERAGFVHRVPSAQDRRVSLVELTRRGWALQPRLIAAWDELARRTVGNLSKTERETLHRLLIAAADNLADPGHGSN
jgi:DNA-binding MarR family transcriptional regulator